MCVWVCVQWETCCSYISVQFVPNLKLKFHFQVVNCLPLCPLADSELKCKLGWPCTTARCTSQSVSLFLSLSLSPSLSHSLFCSALSSLCPIMLSSLLLSFLVIRFSLLSTYLLFTSNSSPCSCASLPAHLPLCPLMSFCFLIHQPLSLSSLSSPFSSYQWICLCPSFSVLFPS